MARSYPNFSLEQRTAVLREMQSQLHPRGRDLSLSDLLHRLLRFTTSQPSNGLPPPANFAGNLTAVTLANNHLMVMAQQPDCSLTLGDGVYTVNFTGPMFSYTVASLTPHYEQVLHNAAGLTTTGGNYPAGCGNTANSTTTREFVTNGYTSTGLIVHAGNFYDLTTQQNQVFTSVAKADETFISFSSIGETNSVVDLTTADLNNDGNSDLILINDPVATTGSATVSVSLGKSDGTYPVPAEITLPGNYVSSAVVDDFNGDGKLDIVAASSQGFAGVGIPLYLSFLAGNGDGTFQPIKTYNVTPPAGLGITYGQYFGLISADLRGSGHKDLVSAAGIVLFGNGDGTFTQSSRLAFPFSAGTSQYSPNVVAADFNKDGKIDLATDNGATILIYLGNGDGTFARKAGYSTIENIGYLVAQDIDGDGNVDLYSGTGNNGSLGGDQFDFNSGYALMGNGDGTFRGAPSLPFVYTGTNLNDIDGDKLTDAVGVNADESFTSYIGDGKGNFTAASTLTTSPIELSGQSYTLNGIDSYALADLSGDGLADLVYLGTSFYGPNYVPGTFVALGKSDGSFATPVFVPAPAFLQAPDQDVNPVISSIRLADMNNDGKLDLVFTYDTTSYNNHTNYFGVAVQLGNGDGTFKTTSQLTQVYSGTSAPNPGAFQIGLIGDVNKDGFPDLFTLSGGSENSQSFTLTEYLGKGDGTFGTPAVISGLMPAGTIYGTNYSPIVLADMNNDGAPDIVASETDANSDSLVAIALGNGDGTFRAPSITTFTAQFFDGNGLAVADFNGDGKLDVATASYAGQPGSGISFGNGDGTLQTFGSTTNGNVSPAQAIFVGVGGATIAIDLNGDGRPDLISGSVELLSNGIGSTGGTASSTTLSASASSIAVGQSVTFMATVSGPAGDKTAPTGTVNFQNGTTVLGTGTLDGSGKASFSTSGLTAGSYSVTAVYGGDANFAGSTSSAVPLQVNAAPILIATDTTLAASADSAVQGTNLTFTATVTPVSGNGVPTGTVTFSDAGTQIGTGSVDGTGKASFSTSILSVGSHGISAAYGGDTNYLASASGATVVTISAPPPADFTLALSPPTGSAPQTAGTVHSTLTVASVNGFASTVNLTCSGVPQNATCTLSPASANPTSANPATPVLTIQTGIATSALALPASFPRGRPAFALLGGGVLLLLSMVRVRRMRGRMRGRTRGLTAQLGLGLAFGVCAVCAVLIGCGGSGGAANKTPAGTYQITVTGTSGSLTHSASYTLTVP